MKNDLTYSEAIEKVMLNNGYFAPLKLIYKEIWKYKDRSRVNGKTPDYTIQERVQRDPRFVRIGLGIYALKAYLTQLPKEAEPQNSDEEIIKKHTHVQGMLLEIGNCKPGVHDTYTNDKRYIYQNKCLGNLATLAAIPPFTYEHIISQSARFIDVIWFNSRGFPCRLFEVEDSTDFRDAFIKFMELQDFMTEFYCVAPTDKYVKFEKEKSKSAFAPIKHRLNFLTYEDIEEDYQNRLTRFNIK
jgi:hypothetical protein